MAGSVRDLIATRAALMREPIVDSSNTRIIVPQQVRNYAFQHFAELTANCPPQADKHTWALSAAAQVLGISQ